MDELVQRLSEGDHIVIIGGLNPSLDELEKRVKDIGYVFIKFTGTKGGTKLGVKVDKTRTDLSRADFIQGGGVAHIEGTLTLNYVNIRCVADIDLATLSGTGHIVTLEE